LSRRLADGRPPRSPLREVAPIVDGEKKGGKNKKKKEKTKRKRERERERERDETRCRDDVLACEGVELERRRLSPRIDGTHSLRSTVTVAVVRGASSSPRSLVPCSW
jgi:hypothetical protein